MPFEVVSDDPSAYIAHYWWQGSPCLAEDPLACWQLVLAKRDKRMVLDFSVRGEHQLLHVDVPLAAWRNAEQGEFISTILSGLNEHIWRPHVRGDEIKFGLTEKQKLVREACDVGALVPIPSTPKAAQAADNSVPESDPALLKILNRLTSLVVRPTNVDVNAVLEPNPAIATREDLDLLFSALVREIHKHERSDSTISFDPDGRPSKITHSDGTEVRIERDYTRRQLHIRRRR